MTQFQLWRALGHMQWYALKWNIKHTRKYGGWRPNWTERFVRLYPC